ncbi:MAG: gliding motility-associated C-terminal domain-containing protein, partial [Cryomorphaceae bacterium]|nr:gliding motility-associated C-terminal domain-containing protein [Cryomorphaceae bacterium]
LCEDATLDILAEPIGFKLEDTVTTYLWNTGETTPSITIDKPGIYWVDVTINHSYTVRDSIVVEYEPRPEWPHPFGSYLELCNDIGASWQEVLGPELANGGFYLWSTGDFEQKTNISTPGTYWLQVETPCYIETDSFELREINCLETDPYIPSAFTPNGRNPLWIIGGIEENTRVEVYNRWGQRVFYSEDYLNNWWNGTFNGQPLPTGVYTYRIIAPYEGRYPVEKTGTVTIVR